MEIFSALTGLTLVAVALHIHWEGNPKLAFAALGAAVLYVLAVVAAAPTVLVQATAFANIMLLVASKWLNRGRA